MDYAYDRWKKGLEAPLLVLDEAVDELHAGTDSVVANRKYAADEIGEASSAIRLRDGLLTCRPPVGSGCSSASGTGGLVVVTAEGSVLPQICKHCSQVCIKWAAAWNFLRVAGGRDEVCIDSSCNYEHRC